MAMTPSVKDELCRLTTQFDPATGQVRPRKVAERKAEVASLLRFAGGLHIVGGRAIVEADLDGELVARRLRTEIGELYNQHADIHVLSPTASRKSTRYVVRVISGGDTLSRQTGLIDQRGRPVRGLPPQVVAGTVADAISAWRGAFLAAGSLSDPGRSASLEIVCPGPEAALALVGAARRMGVPAKAREVRAADRVVVRDPDAIGLLLRQLGALRTLAVWEERRQRRESVQVSSNRLANFDDANLRRSARAAVAASARVERALEILGPQAPGHLIQAGELRIAHGQASLEELGQLADPPMTKDAIAGRIRRLLTMADRRARELDIPDTESVVTPEMLDG